MAPDAGLLTTASRPAQPLGSAPNCTNWETDRLACVALTATGSVELLLYQEGGAWTAGTLQGATAKTFNGAPAITFVPTGTGIPDAFFTVFARDGDVVYRATRKAASDNWDDWVKAFDAGSDPDCAMAGRTGRCVVLNPSGGVTLWSWTGEGAPAAADLGGAGVVATQPAIALTGTGRPIVFAGGMDHRLWSRIY